MFQTIAIVLSVSLAAYIAVFFLVVFAELVVRLCRYPGRRRFYWGMAHYWSVVRLRRHFIIFSLVAWVLASAFVGISARSYYGATARIDVDVERPDISQSFNGSR